MFIELKKIIEFVLYEFYETPENLRNSKKESHPDLRRIHENRECPGKEESDSIFPEHIWNQNTVLTILWRRQIWTVRRRSGERV